MLPLNKRIKLALAVGSGWRDSCTGVNTFFRTAFDDWSEAYDCVFVGNLYREHLNTDNEKSTRAPSPTTPSNAKPPSSPRLLFGYLKHLARQTKHAISVRDQLRGRLIVVNEFGCEVMTIAYRLAAPWSTLISIAHTHPGQGGAANHPVRRLIEHLCYWCSSTVVYNSSSTQDLWRRKLGVDEIRGQVIRYGIDAADSVTPEDYPERIPGTVDFLYLAQFYEWKGQLRFLGAWEEACRQSSQPMRLIFVGDGVALPACREYVRDHELGDSVVFLGQRSNGSDYLNGADVQVHVPQEPEAFGLVLTEGMRSRLPIIASDIGGIPEIIINEETGLLVDPASRDSVVNALCRLAADEGLRERFSGNGYERWRRLFTKKHMLDEYDALFLACSK